MKNWIKTFKNLLKTEFPYLSREDLGYLIKNPDKLVLKIMNKSGLSQEDTILRLNKLNKQSMQSIKLLNKKKRIMTIHQKSKTIRNLAIILSLTMIITACNSSRTLKGGAIGSGVGGVIGGVIGNQSDNTAKGAIFGAMIGGAGGALIGNYMDKQAKEIEKDLEGAKIERVGEGIKITFDSGILFGFDSHKLNNVSKTNLLELAETLKKYEDTEILIEGHTDNIGDKEYNQNLSLKRAISVSEQLNMLGIKNSRLVSKGYGESQPLVGNETEADRQKNRRVEIAIYANNKLKRQAKKGNL